MVSVSSIGSQMVTASSAQYGNYQNLVPAWIGFIILIVAFAVFFFNATKEEMGKE